ncbi:MBL fold metallo-hydrolase [Vibrio sp. V31_P5A7T61]|uniref:MBL fold metallo-hydrolase RNA specificity domain-containing protein n=1 Tax=unclassified Vibrio TaxID=2614977 RepID=UPI001373790D|nr:MULTISPECIES: MBL fold metallo-hydrolase [unclassified Vibrio]NAW60751.1 MBL fold metallo-hydrolase [Vibrio sp. V31_P5A7T61]NAX03387.1 MBL fold metallo-hydrolase [Vibrio sp. V34_P3A8T189]NAX62350.1 MBL fold metallo-hydrolase [Vibrio sp. V32_P6A28T40]
MQILHHGGKNTVTGSCHELRVDGVAVLIDCGLFQGKDATDVALDFPVEHIDALIVTHAHIDHIGRIPWLLAAGFTGPIYCTPASAELIPLMLEDGLKLQLGLNRQQIQQVLAIIKQRLRPFCYGEWVTISGYGQAQASLQLRFQPAGHILGSAYVELRLANGEVVVFSGDLGASNTPLLPDPQSPLRADYLIIETTYGNRNHDDVAGRAEKLREIIQRSLENGGTILIPAFSVGRTQELLFDIERLIFEHKIDADLPIILDSPMAQQVTQSYRRFKALWGEEAKQRLEMHRHPLAFDQCIQITDYRTHQALVNHLASTGASAIVVAASGMCQGGRIVEYLKALLGDERTDVIFAGFQAEGTLGRTIAEGEKSICIDGEEIDVKASIHVMSGYSAHADQSELLAFIKGIDQPPKEIHLIHGERSAKQGFAHALEMAGFNGVVIT